MDFTLPKFAGAVALFLCQFLHEGAGTGTIIPLYSYPQIIMVNGLPQHIWQPLINAYRSIRNPIPTWAIVNPLNGPNLTVDPSYRDGINLLKSNGIKTLGYVWTKQGTRSNVTVSQDIDRWKLLYQVDGIFFDEMANSLSSDPVQAKALLDYYSLLNRYTKRQGFRFTVGNPGSQTPPDLAATLDTIMIYEDDYSNIGNFKGTGSYAGKNFPVTKFGIFPYNVPASIFSTDADAEAIKNFRKEIGFIYVTDDTMGSDNNPWDTLPPYLPQFFAALEVKKKRN